MKFEHEIVFYLFILYPLIATLCYWYLSKKQRYISKYFVKFKILANSVCKKKRLWKIILESLALVLIIFSLARPKMGTTTRIVKQRIGADIILAVDVSNSMMANDIKPSRLYLAKKTLERIIDRTDWHRIGVIAFAGSAAVISPMTTDIQALKLYTDSISTLSVDTQGTNFTKVLELAYESFKRNSIEGTKKAIVIISDGGVTDENQNLGFLEKLKDHNIIIHTMAVGGMIKVPIPIIKDGQVQGYKKDFNGNTVLSKREDGILKSISNVTGGQHYVTSFLAKEIGELYAHFELDTNEDGDAVYYGLKERYQYFLALALLIAFIEILINDIKGLRF